MNLYMLYVGGNAGKSNIEVHVLDFNFIIHGTGVYRRNFSVQLITSGN